MKKMKGVKVIRSAYWYIMMAISTFMLAVKLNSLNKEDKKDIHTTANKVAKKWATFQLKRAGTKTNVYGIENLPEGGVLFVSNHQSYFDVGFFLAYIPKNKGFIAKIETNKIPLVQGAMKSLRCIFLDRKDLRKGAKTILEGIEILKDNYSLVIFPEGTRGENGRMLPFKAGAFKLATKSLVPIVPVTIDGAYKIMPRNQKLIHKAEVDITIHPPIYTKDLNLEEQKNLPQKVYEIIESAITR